MKLKLKPVFTWLGGKSKVIPLIEPYLPEKYNAYIEPFLGGGAMLLYLQPKKAIVNDINEEVINTYNVVKTNAEDIIDEYAKLYEKHNEENYYKVRSLDREESYNDLSNIFKATRFIYITKTAHSGLYRVNKKGQVNSSYGTRYYNIDEENLLAASKYLRENDIKIYNSSYKEILELAKEGDFVYLDPPYAPISKTSDFTRYSKEGFTLEDQKELKLICDELTKKGVKWLQSNSNSDFIKDLYSEYEIVEIVATRGIVKSAKKVSEILIKNY